MEPNKSGKIYPEFIGEWQWDRTYDGWGGWKTPAQMGYTETIIFGSDNIYKKLRNGVITQDLCYTIVTVKSKQASQDSVFVYYLGKNNAQAGQPLFLINSDTLHTRISEVCNDCPEEYYIRKKGNQAN